MARQRKEFKQEDAAAFNALRAKYAGQLLNRTNLIKLFKKELMWNMFDRWWTELITGENPIIITVKAPKQHAPGVYCFTDSPVHYQKLKTACEKAWEYRRNRCVIQHSTEHSVLQNENENKDVPLTVIVLVTKNMSNDDIIFVQTQIINYLGKRYVDISEQMTGCNVVMARCVIEQNEKNRICEMLEHASNNNSCAIFINTTERKWEEAAQILDKDGVDLNY